ncbi:hypothetical protein ASPSYDRAFT_87453 [Aspergillus sydowii CBS 593.65]|uniref:Uncharacterized protein n=1 Tax=Aspergillus sydowii CBS 593.65 TaxID=1036612 RepID=A0A1L9TNM6_9EURO|nr:uncharacterized protein ASPSYDRAFT_87453 [Aspergillus sydowii CBS 593.65]OJJ60883.1 hypothetical protein ASPSYDRAFT_87453 [Aspergillus sydowii CBS 593.65]
MADLGYLELASSLEDAKRLGALGLTASIQPVHAVVSGRGLGSLVTIAASVLSPTVSLRMRVLSLLLGLVVRHCRGLPQIICTLRQREARRGILGIARLLTDRQFRLGICESIVVASGGAAMGIFAENRVGAQDVGVGKLADFVVVDMLWNADALLEAVVKETWYGGVKTLGDGNKRTATLYTDFCHG